MPPGRRLYKGLCYTQGIYTLLTALWALADIHSFMQITGPKTDIWLVKTVATLLLPIGTCLLFGVFIREDRWMVLLLGAMTALGLVIIDLYYTLNKTISNIYLLDGCLEFLFFVGWIVVFLCIKNTGQSKNL